MTSPYRVNPQIKIISDKIQVQKQIRDFFTTAQAMLERGTFTLSFSRHFDTPRAINDINALFHFDTDARIQGTKPYYRGFNFTISDAGATLTWITDYGNQALCHDHINAALNDTGDVTDLIYFVTALSTGDFGVDGEQLLDYQAQYEVLAPTHTIKRTRKVDGTVNETQKFQIAQVDWREALEAHDQCRDEALDALIRAKKVGYLGIDFEYEDIDSSFDQRITIGG